MFFNILQNFHGLSLRLWTVRKLAVIVVLLTSISTLAYGGEERLVAPIPNGKEYCPVFKAPIQNGDIIELAPRGETTLNWSELVTVMRQRSGQTAREFVEGFGRQVKNACDDCRQFLISDTVVNGTPMVGYFAETASPNPARPFTNGWLLMYALKGEFFMHNIQKAWTFEPTTKEISSWVAAFSTARLCDTDSGEQLCRTMDHRPDYCGPFFSYESK